MTSEHVLKPGHVEFTLTTTTRPFHNRVSGAHGAATEPRFDKIGVGAGESYAINGPHDQIGGRSVT